MNLSEILQEKQRLDGRHAKLNTDLMKVVDQINDLEAAERVERRYNGAGNESAASKITGGLQDALAHARGDETAARVAGPTTEDQPVKRRGRPPGSVSKSSDNPNLSDAVLAVVSASPIGVSLQEIVAGLKFNGLSPKPNRLGIAIKRHLKADRLIRYESENNEVYSTPQASKPATQPMPSSAETRVQIEDVLQPADPTEDDDGERDFLFGGSGYNGAGQEQQHAAE